MQEGLHDEAHRSSNGASSHADEVSVALGPCRVACCLASAPNLGLGQTQAQPDATTSGSAASFYEQIGVLAAMHGVGIDLFAVAEAPLGLQALAPICQRSGGACFFYESADGSSLPQVWPLLTTLCQCDPRAPTRPRRRSRVTCRIS